MKKIIISLSFTMLSLSSFSQSFISLQYSMGFTTGNMHDYINKPSFRGGTFDYRNLVTENIGVGFELGWNTFYQERPEDVYDNGRITYAGKQWRYSNEFPMMVAVDYYWRQFGNLYPYGGLGIGTMYSLQKTDMASLSFERDAWHFALKPEIGVIFDMGNGVGFNLVSKYYHGFKSGDLPSQGFFTINVGFVFVN